MTVRLPDGVAVVEVTDLVLIMAGQGDWAAVRPKLQSTFGLSPDDADLVYDRVCGGLVRALTGNPSNRPSRDKDPFAWTSFDKATENPAIITAVYPEYAPQVERLRKLKAKGPPRPRFRWPRWRRPSE